MKQGVMIVMVTVFSLVYFAINWYVYSRGIKALEASNATHAFTWIYWIIASTFVIGQWLERGDPGALARSITLIGSLWLVFFLYSILFIIAVDLVRLFHHWFHFIPASLTTGIFSGKMLFIYALSIGGIMTTYGYINANNPHIKELNLTLDKKQTELSQLKVVLATDVHLGVLLRNKKAEQLLNDINAQNPDLVFFGGDLVDHNPVPVVKNNLGKYIEKIKANLGVYAVTGNHEYIGNAKISVDYFEKHGVEYIRDTVITLPNGLQVAGRDDREGNGYTGSARKSADDLLAGVDKQKPLLLLDHQPVDYDKVVEHGVDLMMSGHTHKGQLWPLGYITKLVFENDYGLYKRGKTNFYTSTGYGTWGPPVRTGNRPELVVFNLTFE